MKTIEEKAKAYDEARERAKHVKLTNTKENVAAAEYIFPDLKESEDERIRKMCIAAVNIAASADGGLLHSEASKCLAWLEEQKDKNCLACDQHLKGYIAGRKVTEEEKQKEQKPNPLCGSTEEYYREAYYADRPQKEQKPVGLNLPKDFKQAVGEVLDAAKTSNLDVNVVADNLLKIAQKPAEWNDTDMKEARNDLISVCRDWEYGKQTTLLPIVAVRARYFLEHLTEPKPVEWSEEDEKMLNGIIGRGCSQIPYTEPGLRGEQIDWLKNKLKYLRPQPHWKPSEEQMERLADAVESWRGGIGYNELKSLYNDLLKLK